VNDLNGDEPMPEEAPPPPREIQAILQLAALGLRGAGWELVSVNCHPMPEEPPQRPLLIVPGGRMPS
jgi:hypothetical protein